MPQSVIWLNDFFSLKRYPDHSGKNNSRKFSSRTRLRRNLIIIAVLEVPRIGPDQVKFKYPWSRSWHFIDANDRFFPVSLPFSPILSSPRHFTFRFITRFTVVPRRVVH